jgi:hypothetical protein
MTGGTRRHLDQAGGAVLAIEARQAYISKVSLSEYPHSSIRLTTAA